MRRLPPLSGLEAFLAVANLGSVKAAAAELALSAPALSRRIQTLERHIGEPLFDREHQSINLNATGARLRDVLGPALDALEEAFATAITQPQAEMRFRLNVLPLFAQQRLFPRMPDMRAKHPNLHIDIETRGQGEARLAKGVDAAIVLTSEVDPAHYSIRLDRDKVYPIAARKFAEGPQRISVPEQLQRMTVLVHGEMSSTFDAWKKAIGMPWLEPASVDQFDSGPLMLEAAAQGVGVAFMHGHHLDDSHDDRLVRLFDFDVDSPYSYWFICRPSALKRPAVKLFRDWLLEAKL